ncbi:MAG: M1 family aminopeptidase [Blastocatellia bacterium]
MKRNYWYSLFAGFAFTAALLALTLFSGTGTVQAQKDKDAADIDVQNYRIDAELVPTQQLLRARTEVTFAPLTDTRSVIFEMNGSLAIKSITLKDGVVAAASVPTTPAANALTPVSTGSKQKPAPRGKTPEPATGTAKPGATTATGLQFIQDQRENMNVRIDLGGMAHKGQPVTLVFEYEGALESPQGGPIQNARLAYVGEQGSYLMYASRWFPFHDYAADRATSTISLKVPKEIVAAGYSEQPVTPVASRDEKTKQEFSTYTFVSTKPTLPGNFAAAKYIKQSFDKGGISVDVYVKPGDEKGIDRAGELISEHLVYYSSKFGPYNFGNRYIVAETDDDTLDSYTGAGMLFLTPKALATGNEDLLAREVAYQWWGQTVGLKSFDDIWLSQGLAQFSALLYKKDNESETQFQQAVQAETEKALAFEQSASIRNAPKQLDDQTPAYRSVIFNKGALVFNMLRQIMGEKDFDAMLREYYQRFNGKNMTLDQFEEFVSQKAGHSLRGFFGQWVDSTGVPEFRAEYRILRRAEGFRVPGTVKQDLDAFEMPVDILLKTEAGQERETILMKGTSADFDLTTKSKPIEVIVDPDMKIMRTSEEIKQAVVVRRGIEHFKEQEYIEAEQQFQAAIKLNRGNSWAWYNLGLLYMTQRNYQKALDAFDMALNGNVRPDWIEVWSYIYRGNAWDALAQRERAVAEYKKALDNGNNYDNAQKTAQKYMEQPFDQKKNKQVASN